MPRLSAVGISGLQAGEDVKHTTYLNTANQPHNIAMASAVDDSPVGLTRHPLRRPPETPLTSCKGVPQAV